MRSRALVVALVLAGCGGGETPQTKQQDEHRGAPSGRPDAPRKQPEPETAAVGTPAEKLELRVGNRRALIYTWRGRFPRTLPGSVEWILKEDEYVKTDDLANTWKVVYCTKDGAQLLQIAACEYVSPQAASETYDRVLSKIEKPEPMATGEGWAPATIDKATTAKLGDHALAAVLSSRYLFIFDRPQGDEIAEAAVKEVVKACFTEPKGE
jgi:hypothetical protein